MKRKKKPGAMVRVIRAEIAEERAALAEVRAEMATKRPTFWMWGDPITVRNEIRERWEAMQREKRGE